MERFLCFLQDRAVDGTGRLHGAQRQQDAQLGIRVEVGLGSDGQPARRRDPRLALGLVTLVRRHDGQHSTNHGRGRHDRDDRAETAGRPTLHRDLTADPGLLGRLLGRASLEARGEVAALLGGGRDGGLRGPRLELRQTATVEQEARIAVGFDPTRRRRA